MNRHSTSEPRRKGFWPSLAFFVLVVAFVDESSLRDYWRVCYRCFLPSCWALEIRSSRIRVCRSRPCMSPVPACSEIYTFACTRLRRTFRLHQKVDNIVLIIDSTPRPVSFPANQQHHYIEMPIITGRRSPAPQIAGNWPAKFKEPERDSFVRYIQARFREQVLDIPEVQCEPRVEPCAWKTFFARSTPIVITSLMDELRHMVV